MYPPISHGEYYEVGDSHRDILLRTMFQSHEWDQEILNQFHEWIYGGLKKNRVEPLDEKG